MKKIAIEIKWAILFACMTLLWMLMERLFGFHDKLIEKHAVITNFVAVPAISIYVFALLDKRKNYYKGFMSYGQAFVTGVLITVFVTLLTPFTQYITSAFISPDYFNNVIAYVTSNELMTRSAAEEYFNLNSYIVQGLIFAPVMGILTSSIVAVFIKRKPK